MNWAFQKEQKEEVANHFHVFVGDLSSGAYCVPATVCATASQPAACTAAQLACG